MDTTTDTRPDTQTRPELVELGRFFTIAARRIDAGQAAPGMFSAAVDAAWHRLLDSPGYEAFCTAAAGRVLGHHEERGHGHVAWVGAYEEPYGPLPEIWFTDEDGILDTAALARYRKDGTVTASWSCSPAGGGDDVAPAPTDHAPSVR
ncbi:hypothetical protein ACFXKJ_41100 [Kitasatospora indigofera]|uniref:hypothetical protein n=1 Tax=Kitasatospora indigofera TaxID=67307 RepID=UPI00367B2A88